MRPRGIPKPTPPPTVTEVSVLGFWVFCGDEAFIPQNGDQLFDLPRSSSYTDVRLLNAYGRLLNADVRLLNAD
ncbi:hypothetical protein TCAL_16297, partial [Tigriopus californicus]